jgi:hypothetical protein
MAKRNNAGIFSFLQSCNTTLYKIIPFIILGILLIFGFWTTYETQRISKHIKLLTTEKDLLGTQCQDLINKRDILKKPERLEKLGREMGLHPPTDKQTVFLKQ